MITKRSKWWVFFVTACGTSLVFLDSTVMPVALPTIQKHFGFSDVTIVWVVNIYLLTLTCFLLIGGRLSDLFGKRTLYTWGLGLFGFGSIMSAISFSKWFLLVGRVIQGLGGALTLPTNGAILISVFPKGERARAIGINTGVSSVFLIIGPVIGGLLTQYLSWRSIFILNIPVVIFGISMAYVILYKEKRKHEGFHFLGALLLMIAMASLVVGLMQANVWGWTSWGTWVLLVMSPLFFFAFGKLSLRQEHPIIDLHFFRRGLFLTSVLSILMVQIVVMVTVLWAIYFQTQLHYTPVQTGLIIFIAATPVILMAPIGGYISDHLGPRLPLLCGFGLLVFSLFWLMSTIHTHKFLIYLPGLLAFGAAIPLIMSPAVALALSQTPATNLGAASAITLEIRQLASTTGIAMMTAVFHTTLVETGSHLKAFIAVSLAGSIFAIAGFFIVIFTVKNAPHT